MLVSFCERLPQTKKTGEDFKDDESRMRRESLQKAISLIWRHPEIAMQAASWCDNRLRSLKSQVDSAVLFKKAPTEARGIDAEWLYSLFVMLSSIGVRRRDAMPFPILNACGVLDAKAAGEDSVVNSAKANGYSYTIVRPGQLFGGPYDNNYYLGTLFQLDKDAATQDVVVGRGDELLGDTLRSTLAEVTAQICEGDSCRDLDFAVINEKGDVPTGEDVKERLNAL